MQRLRISDLMSSRVVGLVPSQTLRQAGAVLRDNNVSGAPVLSNGSVVGVLSLTDIADFISANPRIARTASNREPQDESATEDVIDRHRVEEVMTRNVISLPASADLFRAASYMLLAGIHRVLVMEGEKLLGVLSATDIARAIALRGARAQ